MWAGSYFGKISPSYRENWTPHTVRPDQESPDIFDAIAGCDRFADRLDAQAADKCFSDMIQVDWGGWAYKVTKEQARAYNRIVRSGQIPESIIESMENGEVYGIIDVELY